MVRDKPINHRGRLDNLIKVLKIGECRVANVITKDGTVRLGLP